MRKCGDCSLCCDLIEVAALGKAAGERCPHLKKSSCSIYGEPSRPFCCHSFQCLWTRRDMAAILRPDRSGVLFEEVDERNFLATVDPFRPDAWKRKDVFLTITSMLSSGFAVVVTIGKEKNVMLPKGRSVETVWSDYGKALEKMKWRLQATQRT